MDDIKYFTGKDSKFYKSSGGFIGLKTGDKDYGRISVYKAFPFSNAEHYLSVRDKEGKEIGIVRNINEFDTDTVNLINEEINRRYLIPVIKKIKNIKEEYGYAYWNAETDIGERKFTVKRDNNTFVLIKDYTILIIDVDGNRYEISDYSKLDKKSFKFIELML